MVESSEEDRFGYDELDCGSRRHAAPPIAGPARTVDGPTASPRPARIQGSSARGGKIPVKSQGDSSGGKFLVNNQRDSSTSDAQIHTDDDIPMEDGDSHGRRRYPEDGDT